MAMAVCHANAGEQRCKDEERKTRHVGSSDDVRR